MKKLLPLAILLALTGCGQTTFLTKEKPIVVMPDQSMFVCPDTVVIPDINTLTDIQVAQVILELKRDLEICRNQLKNLDTFLTEAKKRIEK
jgi:uncharacterized lipoprotein YajG